MHKLLFFVILITGQIFCSCNNSEKEGTVAEDNTPAVEKQIRAMIAAHPDSLVLKEKLIQYFRENKNYSQAIAETDLALKKDSLNERMWYMKAMLLSENDDTTQAIKAWEKTIDINPNPEYLLSLGTLYAFSKNPKALIVADSLLVPRVNAKNQAFFIKGLYYSSTGDKIRAAGIFDTCISLDYTNTLAYREKAICLYDIGKYEAALKVLELAIQVKKDYDEAYYWMGRCHEKLNKQKEAIHDYQMAIQLSPDDYIEAKDALEKLGVKP